MAGDRGRASRIAGRPIGLGVAADAALRNSVLLVVSDMITNLFIVITDPSFCLTLTWNDQMNWTAGVTSIGPDSERKCILLTATLRLSAATEI